MFGFPAAFRLASECEKNDRRLFFRGLGKRARSYVAKRTEAVAYRLPRWSHFCSSQVSSRDAPRLVSNECYDGRVHARRCVLVSCLGPLQTPSHGRTVASFYPFRRELIGIQARPFHWIASPRDLLAVFDAVRLKRDLPFTYQSSWCRGKLSSTSIPLIAALKR